MQTMPSCNYTLHTQGAAAWFADLNLAPGSEGWPLEGADGLIQTGGSESLFFLPL
jgi:hypothetical protein